ncbi:MAG TPA: hypothetical protein VMF90_21345 [Rhizobiaceae bacterium]|nr:hypothetical protein [Rhizobiaceae bacterium]
MIVPFYGDSDLVLAEGLAKRAETGNSTQRDDYPEQFRKSFRDALIVADPIPLAAIHGKRRADLFDAESCHMILLDARFGALVLFLESPLDRLDEQETYLLYRELCDLKIERLEGALRQAVSGATLTWSFSINVLVGYDHAFTDFEKRDSYLALCNAYSKAGKITSDTLEDYDLLHEVGSTGSTCLIRSKAGTEYSAERVVALWVIFWVYYATSIEDFSELSRTQPSSHRKLSGRQLATELRSYVDTYNHNARRINLFDPFNICTHGFDEAIYSECWKVLDAEGLTSKMERISTFFIDNAEDVQREITTRYETVVQFLLGGIAIVQVYPIVRDLLPETVQKDYFWGRGVPFAASLVMAGLCYLAAKWWSSR